MEHLKQLKEKLIEGVYHQTSQGLQSVDREELGEAIDMIKDIEEILYYCSITKAMEEKEQEEKYTHKYFSSMNYPTNYNNGNRMYYSEGNNSRNYSDRTMSYPTEIRDYREGRSPVTRRNYMEGKETHHDKTKQLKELEKYVQELSGDILEMISDASPEEKIMLSQKINTLAEKIK